MYELEEKSPVESLEPGQPVELLVRPTEPADQCRVIVQAPPHVQGTVPVQLTYDSESRGHTIRFNIPQDAQKGFDKNSFRSIVF